MSWLERQAGFAKAVRDPAATPPRGIAPSGKGEPAVRRFSVYRNNHVLSLIDVLASRFPVVEAVTGKEFFREMARAYVLANPPASPVLIEYGSGFAGFVRAFAPAAGLPFLADLASLEWSIAESFHAADAPSCDIAALASAAESAAEGIGLRLHPSLRLLQSEFPVFSIWSAHAGTSTGVDLADIALVAEAGVVVRPALTVDVVRLEPGAYGFLSAVSEGAGLEEAAALAGADNQQQLAGLLSFVFRSGFVAGISAPRG